MLLSKSKLFNFKIILLSFILFMHLLVLPNKAADYYSVPPINQTKFSCLINCSNLYIKPAELKQQIIKNPIPVNDSEHLIG